MVNSCIIAFNILRNQPLFFYEERSNAQYTFSKILYQILILWQVKMSVRINFRSLLYSLCSQVAFR